MRVIQFALIVPAFALLGSVSFAPSNAANADADAKVIPSLIEQLGDEDGKKQWAAWSELQRLGEPAQTALEAAAKDESISSRARRAAEQILFDLKDRETQRKQRVERLVDADRMKQVPVVMRVQLIRAGEGSKYVWPTVRVLRIYKNTSGRELGRTLKVAHYSSAAEGIPAGECTIYLEPYNSTKDHPWKLLRGDGKFGVSHPMKHSESVTLRDLRFTAVAQPTWTLPKKGGTTSPLFGLRVENTAMETALAWPFRMSLHLETTDGLVVELGGGRDGLRRAVGFDLKPGESELFLFRKAALRYPEKAKGPLLAGPDWTGGWYETATLAAGDYKLGFVYRSDINAVLRPEDGPFEIPHVEVKIEEAAADVGVRKAISQPSDALTARVAETKELFDEARQTWGDHGCLAIRSQARWDEMQKRLTKLGWKPPKRHALSNVNFRDDMIVLIYKCGDERDQFSVSDYNPMGMPPKLDVAMSYVIYRRRAEVVNRCNVIMMAVPRLRTLQVSVRTYHPFNGGKHPTAEKGKLEWQGFVGTEVSDHVDELNAKIKPKDTKVKAGDDISIDFSLVRSDAVKGKPGQFASQRTSLWVWDGKYSGGYRNHAFDVKTPDGKTHRLRPKLQLEWRKNIPHPIEIRAGKPYTLPNWREGEFLKSLQQLGLDTSKPGTYTITGIYEQQVGENFRRKDDPASWGGTIASNTITVEVVE